MKEYRVVIDGPWERFKTFILKWTLILGGGGAGIALMTYMSNR